VPVPMFGIVEVPFEIFGQRLSFPISFSRLFRRLMWSDVHAQVGQLFEDFCAGRGILNKLFCYPVRYPKLPVIDAGKGIKQYPHQADIEAETKARAVSCPG